MTQKIDSGRTRNPSARANRRGFERGPVEQDRQRWPSETLDDSKLDHHHVTCPARTAGALPKDIDKRAPVQLPISNPCRWATLEPTALIIRNSRVIHSPPPSL